LPAGVESSVDELDVAEGVLELELEPVDAAVA
jgi:hypothetical protein